MVLFGKATVKRRKSLKKTQRNGKEMKMNEIRRWE